MKLVIGIYLLFPVLLFGQEQPIDKSIYNFTPEFFEKQIFAHRGGYSYGPENTLQTILFNIANNINCVEIDIRMTKDNELVVFHDETIERVLECESPKKISEITLPELKTYPFRNKQFGQIYITTFQELVDTLTALIPRRKMNFLLELDWKPSGDDNKIAIQKLKSMVAEKEKIFGDGLFNYFYLTTFYPDVLKLVKKEIPKIKRGFAIIESPAKHKFSAKLARMLANHFVKKYDVSVIEPSLCLVSEKFVKKWHRRKIMINAYTANSNCEKNYLTKLGVAYATNCPGSNCYGDESDMMGKPTKWCKSCIGHEFE